MPDSKKKLLFYIGTIGGGGAERVLLELLKHLDRDKYRLSIVMNRLNGRWVTRIPPDVKIIDRSEIYRSVWFFLKRVLGLAGIINREKPDLVISFLTGANRSLLRCRFLVDKKIKFVLREGSNPDNIKKSSYTLKEKVLSPIEVKILYSKADRIITASKGVMNNFVNNWGMQYDRFTVIHNMVDIKKVDKSLEYSGIKDPFKKNIIAVGRLIKEKGYNDMLKVFSNIKRRIPSRLIILGDGPERANIEELIKDLSLENDVCIPGFVNNPWEYMKASDVYLSTSHYEGFHLTIAEAMACGTVPVATDCDYGPREIITDGKNGRLLPVGDIEGLCDAIVQLLQDDKNRAGMSQEARERAKDFDVHKIVRQYEEVFDSLPGG